MDKNIRKGKMIPLPVDFPKTPEEISALNKQVDDYIHGLTRVLILPDGMAIVYPVNCDYCSRLYTSEFTQSECPYCGAENTIADKQVKK